MGEVFSGELDAFHDNRSLRIIGRGLTSLRR
jgi:hypothetical protein